MLLLKCPKCKESLVMSDYKINKEHITVQIHRCVYCLDTFERHMFFNSIGLIVDDNLYRIDKNGYLMEKV